MNLFDTAFLIATHRVAIINTCSLHAGYPGLKTDWLFKFRTAVGQDYGEDGTEVVCPQSVFQTIKYAVNSALGATGHQPCEEQFCIGIIKSQDTLAGAFRGEDRIHLHEIFRGKCLKVLIGPADKGFPVADSGLGVFPRLEPRLPFQINVTGQKDALVNVVVEGLDADAEFRMVCDDLVRRLPLRNQR